MGQAPQDSPESLGRHLPPPPSEQRAGSTPSPEVKAGKGITSPRTEICPQRLILLLPAGPQGADFASETRVSVTLCWVSQLLEDVKPLFTFEQQEIRAAGLAGVGVLWPCQCRGNRCGGEGAQLELQDGLEQRLGKRGTLIGF